jgi:ribonucleoside-diphosphate reductase alpha chain
MTAWEKGVKSTYYLHMKPRHTAEQSTVAVNKGAALGKVGFGAIKRASSVVAKPVDESELMASSAPVTMTVEEEMPKPTMQMPEPVMAHVPQPVAAQVSQMALDIERIKNASEPVKVMAQVPEKKSPKPNVVFAGGKTCPTDPAELNQCDSCQ